MPEEFAEAVREAIAVTNNLAENASPFLQENMFQAFETASKLKWIFWDAAYREENWPIG